MRTPARQWVGWFAALALLTVGMLSLRHRLDKAHVALAYLLAVLGASAAGGRALGLAVAGAAFLAFNYLFIPPYQTLVISDPLDWLVLFAFLVTSVVAAQLLYRATSTAEAATQRADELDRLASLGAETLSAPGAVEALQAIANVIRTAIDADVCEVYRRGADGRLVRATSAIAAAGADGAASAAHGAAERSDGDARDAEVGAESLVGWLADTGRSAVELADGTVRLAPEDRAEGGGAHGPPYGRRLALAVGEVDEGADVVRAVLLPLVVRDHTVGVLRIASARGVAVTPEQARLLVALAYYAALGVERLRLVESAERAEAERRLESLRSALLTAVSHDLRTPLTTIKGIAHEIGRGADPARAAVIEAEADRLDRLVGDLLDLSRIQAGAVRPVVAVNTADELIGAALQRAAGALGARPVEVEMPDDALLAGRFDFTQALRVLVNLLENAAKYAPGGAPIQVRARREGDRLAIAVLDRGPGVPPGERARIFESFYRPPGTPPDVRGTGLGLSIARGLAEAQGGSVRYEERAGGGSVLTLELPAADEPAAEAEPPAGDDVA